MSLILDALNRADTERKNQTPVPDLNTLHRPLSLEPDTTPRPWLWWGAAGVVLAVVAILVWRWSAVGDTPVSPAAATAVESPHQTASITTQTSISQPVKQAAGAQALSSPQPLSPPATSLTSAVAIKPDNQAVAAADVKNLYAEEIVSATADADVSQLYAVEESTGSESVVDPFASLPVAQASLPPADVVREPAHTFDSTTHIQDFNELPWNTKQKMPTISYQRHDYLAGGISSVVINGQTLGVGNIVATGQFVVQDILVDGVVLKHGDRVFKLRALNGWINM